jgi:hypothetical protein
MKTVKAVYDKGKIKLSEKPSVKGPLDVIVVFPEEDGDAAWERILNDKRPRPKLIAFMEEVKKQIAEGKAKPLRLEDL